RRPGDWAKSFHGQIPRDPVVVDGGVGRSSDSQVNSRLAYPNPVSGQCTSGRRERSRWRGGRYASCKGRRSASTESNVGSQGGPCDPTTQNDAGGTPAS